jgi:hypothetical protein
MDSIVTGLLHDVHGEIKTLLLLQHSSANFTYGTNRRCTFRQVRAALYNRMRRIYARLWAHDGVYLDLVLPISFIIRCV